MFEYKKVFSSSAFVQMQIQCVITDKGLNHINIHTPPQTMIVTINNESATTESPS